MGGYVPGLKFRTWTVLCWPRTGSALNQMDMVVVHQQFPYLESSKSTCKHLSLHEYAKCEA